MNNLKKIALIFRGQSFFIALVVVIVFGYVYGKDLAFKHNSADKLYEAEALKVDKIVILSQDYKKD